jgi:hypothetical protein
MNQFMSIVLSTAARLLPAAQAESLFEVNKNETKCEAPNVCAYAPEFRLNCKFAKDGSVQISKQYIAGMAGPVIPLPALDRTLNLSDLTLLNNLTGQIVGESLMGTQNTSGRAYQLFGTTYASSDAYNIMQAPEAAQLVALADKYCHWDFLRLVGN